MTTNAPDMDAIFDEDTVELQLSPAEVLALSRSVEHIVAERLGADYVEHVERIAADRAVAREAMKARPAAEPVAAAPVAAMPAVATSMAAAPAVAAPVVAEAPVAATAVVAAPMAPVAATPIVAAPVTPAVVIPAAVTPAVATPKAATPTAAPAQAPRTLQTKPTAQPTRPAATIATEPVSERAIKWSFSRIAGVVAIAVGMVVLAGFALNSLQQIAPAVAEEHNNPPSGQVAAPVDTVESTATEAPDAGSAGGAVAGDSPVPASAAPVGTTSAGESGVPTASAASVLPAAPTRQAGASAVAARPAAAQAHPTPHSITPNAVTPNAVTQPVEVVQFKNPFDRSEVFEFPAGTSKDAARDQVAEALLQRARERRLGKAAP